MAALSGPSAMLGALEEELSVFAGCVGAGIAAGALYDVMRLMRLLLRRAVGGSDRVRTALEYALDAVYLLLVSALFFAALVALNGGELRLYAIVALFGALALYLACVSKYVARLTGKLVAAKPKKTRGRGAQKSAQVQKRA